MARTPWVVALGAAFSLGWGCASVPRDAGVGEVNRLVEERTGHPLQWQPGAPIVPPSDAELAARLAGELTVERAVEVALAGNRDLLAALEELGIARADLIAARTVRNPFVGRRDPLPRRGLQAESARRHRHARRPAAAAAQACPGGRRVQRRPPAGGGVGGGLRQRGTGVLHPAGRAAGARPPADDHGRRGGPVSSPAAARGRKHLGPRPRNGAGALRAGQAGAGPGGARRARRPGNTCSPFGALRWPAVALPRPGSAGGGGALAGRAGNRPRRPPGLSARSGRVEAARRVAAARRGRPLGRAAKPGVTDRESAASGRRATAVSAHPVVRQRARRPTRASDALPPGAEQRLHALAVTRPRPRHGRRERLLEAGARAGVVAAASVPRRQRILNLTQLEYNAMLLGVFDLNRARQGLADACASGCWPSAITGWRGPISRLRSSASAGFSVRPERREAGADSPRRERVNHSQRTRVGGHDDLATQRARLRAGALTAGAAGRFNRTPLDAPRRAGERRQRPTRPSSPPTARRCRGRWEDGLKTFHLIAEPVVREFAPGFKVNCWGYNGQTPGPDDRGRRGRPRADLRREPPPRADLRALARRAPAQRDGRRGRPQPAADRAGRDVRVRVHAAQHGTQMYHPHFDEMVQSRWA